MANILSSSLENQTRPLFHIFSDYGPAPEVCQYVKLNAISNSECSDFYGGNSIADSVICAGDDTSDEGVCFGDSGGPLVCNENGKAVLVGVTSFTAGQHCADLPSGYARVTHVLDWIKESLVIFLEKIIWFST